ncbi:(deoxy)nucleoside triphosphate pyrophosphohydrolase [Novosphingobium sp. YAF33]|uniref:(deoxy)nucleoside triphosphate pyrophosphohydrolase n=1 Tax=Novosphingobium sp. YAF33 TaxID=3233082 RepID=UPI003F9C1781
MALLRADGRVLMQQRPLASQHGGLWEFPGGKVEAGETPEMAAARELHEELGVALAPEALMPVGFASGPGSLPSGDEALKARAESAGGGGRAIVILLYACRAWEGEPEAHEAEALGWYMPGEIPGLDMPPLDYPLAAALSTILAQNAI